MKNQAIAADPHEPRPMRAAGPAHHERHRRHPPRPARGDGDLERDHPQFVEPLLLRDVYGLPYEEIAQQVGAPLGTIKAQIHHGRRLVRPMLRGDGVRRTAAAVATAALLAGGCSSANDEPSDSASPAPAVRLATAEPPHGRRGPAADGLSEPVEDSVYPDVGDPSVDALHYDLDLRLGPRRPGPCAATETLELRATADADHLQLDLARAARGRAR